MDRAQQIVPYRRFRQGQQKRFIDRARGALRGRIEFANGLDLIAEKLDAQGTIGLG
jgi:hypothetical protein